MRLGVCYYPEHWPEKYWAGDARRMAELGLTRVRIGEFAWSRIEPEPGRFDWGWLDRAIDTLAGEGIGVILCTPTATPPKWLVDQMPDMVAIDADGRPRKFGSRRHYCFSHRPYREECARVVGLLAKRYGDHPAVVAWQIDNEYGCHDTVVSYSAAAARHFREWLRARYGTIEALNAAWGTVFWSQEYRDFDAIDPPHLAVTEQHPAHVFDYRRFASDEVVSFNRMQADIVRRYSPGRDIMHNFMGFFTQFDHHAVARDLDVVGWDSYPLGFLEQFWFPQEDKLRYARQGHPDIAAFHHDLYRGCAPGGRWWVIEQQPGPVNWAAYNPAPLPGMVRLWTLEAFAHGAELMSYFRWRQAPFGQEQMHAGLLRPDRSDDVAVAEVRAAVVDLNIIGECSTVRASVALIFNYEAAWLFETQPQGASFNYMELVFGWYSALRRLGLDIDIVAPGADHSAYRMVVAPSLPIVDAALVARLGVLDCPVLIGPRSGSKTADFSIPPSLPPGGLQDLIPLRVPRVESLRPGIVLDVDGGTIERWVETVETALVPEIVASNGDGILFRRDQIRYLAGWADAALLDRIMCKMAKEAGLATVEVPRDVRVRRHGALHFAFNYGAEPVTLGYDVIAHGADILVGRRALGPADLAVWRRPPE
ncbi:MAG: beta-galactosidase [Pseudomonadota bacterium]|nr:beta-galactosidase [Pseudomonadota bacterium]